MISGSRCRHLTSAGRDLLMEYNAGYQTHPLGFCNTSNLSYFRKNLCIPGLKNRIASCSVSPQERLQAEGFFAEFCRSAFLQVSVLLAIGPSIAALTVVVWALQATCQRNSDPRRMLSGRRLFRSDIPLP